MASQAGSSNSSKISNADGHDGGHGKTKDSQAEASPRIAAGQENQVRSIEKQKKDKNKAKAKDKDMTKTKETGQKEKGEKDRKKQNKAENTGSRRKDGKAIEDSSSKSKSAQASEEIAYPQLPSVSATTTEDQKEKRVNKDRNKGRKKDRKAIEDSPLDSTSTQPSEEVTYPRLPSASTTEKNLKATESRTVPPQSTSISPDKLAPPKKATDPQLLKDYEARCQKRREEIESFGPNPTKEDEGKKKSLIAENVEDQQAIYRMQQRAFSAEATDPRIQKMASDQREKTEQYQARHRARTEEIEAFGPNPTEEDRKKIAALNNQDEKERETLETLGKTKAELDEEKTPLDLVTEIKRIKACKWDEERKDYYGVLGFRPPGTVDQEGNDIDMVGSDVEPAVRILRHRRLLKLLHSDKVSSGAVPEELQDDAKEAFRRVEETGNHLGFGRTKNEAFNLHAYAEDDISDSDGGNVSSSEKDGDSDNGDEDDEEENDEDDDEDDDGDNNGDDDDPSNDVEMPDTPSTEQQIWKLTEEEERIEAYSRAGYRHWFVVRTDKGCYDLRTGTEVGERVKQRYINNVAEEDRIVPIYGSPYTKKDALRYRGLRGVAMARPTTTNRKPITFVKAAFSDDEEPWFCRTVLRKVLGAKYADLDIEKYSQSQVITEAEHVASLEPTAGSSSAQTAAMDNLSQGMANLGAPTGKTNKPNKSTKRSKPAPNKQLMNQEAPAEGLPNNMVELLKQIAAQSQAQAVAQAEMKASIETLFRGQSQMMQISTR